MPRGGRGAIDERARGGSSRSRWRSRGRGRCPGPSGLVVKNGSIARAASPAVMPSPSSVTTNATSAASALHVDADRAPRRRRVAGVEQQVDERVLEQQRLAPDRRASVGDRRRARARTSARANRCSTSAVASRRARAAAIACSAIGAPRASPSKPRTTWSMCSAWSRIACARFARRARRRRRARGAARRARRSRRAASTARGRRPSRAWPSSRRGSAGRARRRGRGRPRRPRARARARASERCFFHTITPSPTSRRRRGASRAARAGGRAIAIALALGTARDRDHAPSGRARDADHRGALGQSQRGRVLAGRSGPCARSRREGGGERGELDRACRRARRSGPRDRRTSTATASVRSSASSGARRHPSAQPGRARDRGLLVSEIAEGRIGAVGLVEVDQRRRSRRPSTIVKITSQRVRITSPRTCASASNSAPCVIYSTSVGRTRRCMDSPENLPIDRENFLELEVNPPMDRRVGAARECLPNRSRMPVARARGVCVASLRDRAMVPPSPRARAVSRRCRFAKRSRTRASTSRRSPLRARASRSRAPRADCRAQSSARRSPARRSSSSARATTRPHRTATLGLRRRRASAARRRTRRVVVARAVDARRCRRSHKELYDFGRLERAGRGARRVRARGRRDARRARSSISICYVEESFYAVLGAHGGARGIGGRGRARARRTATSRRPASARSCGRRSS